MYEGWELMELIREKTTNKSNRKAVLFWKESILTFRLHLEFAREQMRMSMADV